MFFLSFLIVQVCLKFGTVYCKTCIRKSQTFQNPDIFLRSLKIQSSVGNGLNHCQFIAIMVIFTIRNRRILSASHCSSTDSVLQFKDYSISHSWCPFFNAVFHWLKVKETQSKTDATEMGLMLASGKFSLHFLITPIVLLPSILEFSQASSPLIKVNIILKSLCLHYEDN